jgi:cysteine synthase B
LAERAGWTVLELDGDLDFTHVNVARRAVHELALTRRGALALDLRGLTFMDTTGVRLILQALQRAEERGADFALIRGPFEVHRVLELVGLTDQLRIVEGPSELDALRAAAPAIAAPPAPAALRRRRDGNDIARAIGDTPLVELRRLSPNPSVRLWAKLESLNPTGSLADRVARAMLQDAEARHALLPGQTILEPTSGNTGIALAMLCARKGHSHTVVIPDNVTPERTALLRMYGAEVVYSPGSRGMHGAIELALSMAAEDPIYHLLFQYGNAANPLAHYEGTGREILREVGEVVAFVAALGTGGTLMGTGRRLREECGLNVKIVGVTREGLPTVPGGFFDRALLERTVAVSDREAVAWTRRLLDEEGIFAGVSSGAVASAAVAVARELDGGNVVFMVGDDGWKYFSSGVHTRPVHQVAGVDETTWW